MYQKIIFCLSLTLLSAACSNPKNSSEQTKKTTEIEAQTEAQPQVPLNDGQKWEVDAAMKPFIIKSEELLTNYLNDDLAQSPTLVGQELEELNRQLIQSCTMTGEAHNALHQWLDPHMKLISQLKNAPSNSEAQPLLEQLRSSFVAFHKHFQ